MGTTAQRACVAERQPELLEPIQGAGIRYRIGLDVGSITVKAVVVEAGSDCILWQDYQRHETRQPEKLLEFLQRMEAEAGIAPDNCRIFITGSGGTG